MHENVDTNCLQFLDIFFTEGKFHTCWTYCMMEDRTTAFWQNAIQQPLPLWITQAIKKSFAHAVASSLDCLGARLKSGSCLKHLLVSVGDLQRVVNKTFPRGEMQDLSSGLRCSIILFHTGSEEWAGNAASVVFSVPQKLRELKEKRIQVRQVTYAQICKLCPRHGMVSQLPLPLQ